MLSINPRKTLHQLLDKLKDNISSTTNCIKIGQIESFNPTKQTAVVSIQHKKTRTDAYGNRVLFDYPVLAEVPVVILGGGKSRITFPISAGDQCLVLFNDFELDQWWVSKEPRPSEFRREHDISDGIALVGIHSLVDLIQGYSNYIDLHYSDDSNIIVGDTVEVNNSAINLNGVTTAEDLHSNSGATGSFISQDNKTVTVVDGIITNIA